VAKKSLWSSSEFSVGSLRYTRTMLLTIMFWMLWADLCLQIMESLQWVIPLQLKWLGASDKIIGFVKDSLQAILTLCYVPIIGMQSDRHRGPLGRRRPFLIWCSIPVCLFLLGLGFVGPITKMFHSLLSPLFSNGLDPVSLGIVLIAVFAAGFFFFNNYILQIYQYLFADVIPKEVMGTFVGLYRAIGAVGAFAFNRWLLGYAETDVSLIYSGGAILYAVAFGLLVWKVKEGEYPPPPEKQPNPLKSIKLYAKECYTNSFYLKIFSAALFFWASWVPFQTFIIFYAISNPGPGYAPSLGINVAEFGKIKAWTFLPTVIIFALCGPLIDKFHSLRILMTGIAGAAVTFFLGFFVVNNADQFLIWWIVNQAMLALFSLSYLAMFPALFPRNKYGQFFSANQMFFSFGLVFAPLLCGWLMDIIKNYRYLFIWSGVLSTISMLLIISLFFHWKKLGGDESFVPPEPGS
jgi:maltose/moltooligosaccharide transporter